MTFWWLIFIFTNSLLVSGDGDWPNPHDDKEMAAEKAAYTAYCTSYCDIYGYYNPPKTCFSPSVPVFCCGDESTRHCCVNANFSVGDRYPDVSYCPNTVWWLNHWRGIIGFLGTMVAVLMIFACCYYCCLAILRDKAKLRRRRQREIPAVSADVEPEARPRLQLMFNPESPNAFTPPDYNSLPKQPPDYAEIMQAYANAGFVNNEDDSSHLNGPPPSYEEPSAAPSSMQMPLTVNDGHDLSNAAPIRS